jgi:hypothetical protein
MASFFKWFKFAWDVLGIAICLLISFNWGADDWRKIVLIWISYAAFSQNLEKANKRIQLDYDIKNMSPKHRVQSRLDQLDLLKVRNQIRPEEYEAKRLEILKDL